MPSHVLRDRRLTQDDAQLPQLAVDARRSPERVGGRQLADQGTHVGWHTGSSGTAPTFPGPEETKAPSMPGDNGLRLDDVQRRSPAAPGPAEPRPQYPVGHGQTER